MMDIFMVVLVVSLAVVLFLAIRELRVASREFLLLEDELDRKDQYIEMLFNIKNEIIIEGIKDRLYRPGDDV
jgi:hypothetical protein